MARIIDLSVKLEDFMPSHTNLQRPFVKPHVTHEESKSRKLGTPDDPMTFTTTFMAMVDHPEPPLRVAGGPAVLLPLAHRDGAMIQKNDKATGRLEGLSSTFCSLRRARWRSLLRTGEPVAFAAARQGWYSDLDVGRAPE